MGQSPIRIPLAVRRFLRPMIIAAEQRNLPLYVVGGCVRDWILGTSTVDIDLVIEGDAEPLARLCARSIGGTAESFGAFGTWRVLGRGRLRVDFAAARKEEYPEPACLPVVGPAGIEQDLFRRDFTINAMAVRLTLAGDNVLVDPYGGRRDLGKKILRFLHPRSFRDDPTRVFRAARFACRFGLTAAPGLWNAARAALSEGYAVRVSRHRLSQELLRVLSEKKPECVLLHLRTLGYLQLIYPGLRWVDTALKGVEERLAAMALALGDEAESFVKSLPIEHEKHHRLMEVIGLAHGRVAPRHIPSAFARVVLKDVFDDLPPAALKVAFLSGADLQKRGMAPGPSYHVILDEAARAQWKGTLTSRVRALRWLERRLK